MISERFLEWFDTLEFNEDEQEDDALQKDKCTESGGRNKRTEGETLFRGKPISSDNINNLQNLDNKTALRKVKSTKSRQAQTTILPILGPRTQNEDKKHKITSRAVPRVAFLGKKRPKKLIGLPGKTNTKSRKTREKTSADKEGEGYQYTNNGPLPGLSVISLLVTSRLAVAPTLIFHINEIIWFGVNGERLIFKDIKTLSSQYRTILEGLLLFDAFRRNDAPVALLKMESNKQSKAIFSRNDILLEMERLCKSFAKNNMSSLAAIQAFIPSESESVRTTWKTERENQFQACKDRSNKRYYSFASKVSKALSTDEYLFSEIVCDFCTDRSKKTWLVNIKNFRRVPNLSTKKSQKKSNNEQSKTKTLKVKRPGWCIGEICSSTGCDDDTTKFTVVYKTIIQYRMKSTKSSDLTQILPSKERRRMFESVKVCRTCSEVLNKFAIEQSEKEDAIKRKKLRDEQLRKKKEKEKLSALKQQSEAERIEKIEKLAEKIEKEEAKLLQHSRKLMKAKKRPKSKSYDPTPEKPSSEVKQQINNTAAKPQATETICIRGITCSEFFGDDAAKLLLCSRIMDILQKRKNVKLFASPSDNNGSEEECCLVLRSIYLEFRGLCADLGFFPDVPIENGTAVMTLNARP